MLLKNVNKLLKYNNELLTLGESPVPPTPDPYNPLNLPAYTIRVKCIDDVAPSPKNGTSVLVDEDNNIWDITYENSNWSELLKSNSYLKEVLGANTSGVTNMKSMFYLCSKLTTIPIFDTSNVTTMARMFDSCRTLTSIPLFDTSKVTDMIHTFYGCYNVESGALSIYQQASTQTNPPAWHTDTFKYCGKDTQTGSAELTQIPSSWGGTGA